MSTQLEEKVEQYLHSQKRDAILILRQPFTKAIDAPARSFLGGLPTLPPSLEWPDVLDKGERKALPRHGGLYFFYSEDWALGCSNPEGHLRHKVLFDPASPKSFKPRHPPQQRFALTDHGAAPIWMDPHDHRLSGGFRFDVKFRTYASFPDVDVDMFWEDDGDEYVVENCQWRLQADSIRHVLGGVRPAMNVPQIGDTFPHSVDWIACWGIISNYANGILLPRLYHAPTDDELERQVCEEAHGWAERSKTKDQFALPPSEVRREFFDWVSVLNQRSQHCSWSLRNRIYPAWHESARHAANRLSELDRLGQIPPEMIEWLCPVVDLNDDRNVDIYVPRLNVWPWLR